MFPFIQRSFWVIAIMFFCLSGLISCKPDAPEPTPSPAFIVFISDSMPGQVAFQNNSKGANSYLWDFGDGATSTEMNPVHIYKGNGTYQVTLKLPGGNGVKFPRGSSGGVQLTQAVTVSNSKSSLVAAMEGEKAFTFSGAVVTATRTNGNIQIYAENNFSSYLKITLPANVVAGGTYNVFIGQPSLNKASFEYYQTNTGPVYANAGSCNGAFGTVNITSVTATSIAGTCSARMLNTGCTGYFAISSCSFNCNLE